MSYKKLWVFTCEWRGCKSRLEIDGKPVVSDALTVARRLGWTVRHREAWCSEPHVTNSDQPWIPEGGD